MLRIEFEILFVHCEWCANSSIELLLRIQQMLGIVNIIDISIYVRFIVHFKLYFKKFHKNQSISKFKLTNVNLEANFTLFF